jgi:hypothetical protein
VSDRDIVETVANIALNIFTNYVNLIARTVVDFPEGSSGDDEAPVGIVQHDCFYPGTRNPQRQCELLIGVLSVTMRVRSILDALLCLSVAISRSHNAQSPVYRCSFKDCITLLHSSNASPIDWYRFAISSMCLMPSRSC